MAGRSLLPDVPTLIRKVERGMTHGEIAEEYGVSRQAVSLKLRGATEPRLWRRDWPWEVQSAHKIGWLYEGITYYVISKTKERPLSERQRSRLSSLMDGLESMERKSGHAMVVDYDPATPVGFFLRNRTEEDDPESILAGGDRS